MNPIRHIRVSQCAGRGLAAALLASGATPAFAGNPGPAAALVPTYPAPSPALPPVVVGGMPGWQIALIAAAAPRWLAATVAVLVDRALGCPQRRSATTA